MKNDKFNHEWLKELVNKSGLRSGHIANKMKINRTTLYNWTNGKTTPDPWQLIRLLQILGQRPSLFWLTDFYTVRDVLDEELTKHQEGQGEEPPAEPTLYH